MSALVGNMAWKVFCCSCLFFLSRVCVHNHPFHWYRSIFLKWSLASWLSWAFFHKRAKGFLIKETSLCSYRRKILVFNFHFFIWFARRNIFVHFSVTKEDCTECSMCDLIIIILFNFIDRCKTYLFFLSERTCNNCSKWSFSVKHLGTSELSITSLLLCQH